jgi:hypothetical protein
MENIFNGLLEFKRTEEFEEFVNSVDKKLALRILELSIIYGQQNGLYTLSESHLIYKSLKKIKENDDEIK